MKILVVEDHALVREMLQIACRKEIAGATLRGAADGNTALRLCRERQPDLLIMDVMLPDIDGLDLLEKLLVVAPHARCIVLSSHVDEFTVHRALRAKVHGFVDKNDDPLTVLRQAIVAVLAGEKYFSASVRRAIAEQRRNPAAFTKVLSDWERSLLALFGQGFSNEDISARISRTAVTVKNHRCRIMTKIGVHNSAQLIRYAIEKGFTRVPGTEITQPGASRPPRGGR